MCFEPNSHVLHLLILLSHLPGALRKTSDLSISALYNLSISALSISLFCWIIHVVSHLPGAPRRKSEEAMQQNLLLRAITGSQLCHRATQALSFVIGQRKLYKGIEFKLFIEFTVEIRSL